MCGDRADFARQSAAQGNAVPSGVQGYYDLDSNRITLYDMGGNADSADWQTNASVLIHEATHQTAFNTGIHSRYCPPPVWLAEGLAMLFEAPGVYDSRNHTQLADRINRDRLRVFQQDCAPHHRPEMLAKLVASDDLFRAQPRDGLRRSLGVELLPRRNRAAPVRAVSEANGLAEAVSGLHGGGADG